MSLAFHNGRFLPYSELVIPPHDAGFVFGATVTDFCRTYAHKLFRWPDHLARLRRDCEACFVPLPYSDAEITAAVETLVAENTKGLAANDDLALITFATPGPLGYMVGEPTNGPPTLAMHSFPIPKERYRRFFTEGVVLDVMGFLPKNLTVPPWVKHRSRIHWWHASHRVPTAGAVPGLTGAGGALDTAIGAVLIVRNDVVELPTRLAVLDSMSAQVVSELVAQFGMEVREANGGPGGLVTNGVSEMLLAGSAFGMAGVRRLVLGKETTDFPWPGPVFTRLAAAWSDMVGLDIVKQFTG
jgi:branched-chain amino acid aminotransferase